jgi:hypothetical protein
MFNERALAPGRDSISKQCREALRALPRDELIEIVLNHQEEWRNVERRRKEVEQELQKTRDRYAEREAALWKVLKRD